MHKFWHKNVIKQQAGLTNHVQFAAGAKAFFLFQMVQTGSAVH